MIVYHGTGGYHLDALLTTPPIRRPRCYVRRKCFCTTTDSAIARLFAVRRTSTDDFLHSRISGVVVEYELSGVEGKDFDHAVDPRSLQDEGEVVVYNTTKLRAVAVWRYGAGRWQREPVNKETADEPRATSR